MSGSSGAVLHPDCCCITANVMGETLIYKLGLPGEHMAVNSLAVLAAAKLTGADLARAALALATAEPAKGRGVREELATADGEPAADRRELQRQSGLRAALPWRCWPMPGRARTAGGLPSWATCWSWETTGPELHADLAGPVDEAGVDVLYAAGPLMANLWGRIPSAKRGAYARNFRPQSREAVLGGLRVGDVVMVKGSLGSRMGPLAEAISGSKFPPVRKES